MASPADPLRPLCMPCWQAARAATIEAHRPGWHQQCPGVFGGYPGVPPQWCQCDCEWAQRKRRGK